MAASMVFVHADESTQSLPADIRWTVALPAPAVAPPLLEGGRVFVALESGTVSAHRATDGVEIWHVDLRSDQGVATEEGRVFVGAGDAIHALNAEDGSVA